ncbi:methyltransferase domain-containing protein [Patescibacteria group bacterium]|nr:methyltransferase domain-containing protein [Patescibacteria group bacterium]
MEKDAVRIQLGGGEIRKEGYLNIDILNLPTVDIVADITKGIPLPDNSVSEVRADYLFEHIPDTVALMKELYRICKPDAVLRIKVPYFKSTAAFKDPTHVSFFTERTFEYFDARYAEQGTLPEYQLNMDFRVTTLTYNYYTRGTKYLPFVGLLRRFCWDIVKSLVVELRVVKNL